MISQLEFLGLKRISITRVATINTGSYVDGAETPPLGQCYQIMNAFATILAPAGASAGTHALEIFNGISESSGTDDTWVKITSLFGDPILIRGNLLNGTSSELPATDIDQFNIWSSSWFNNTRPLYWKYSNDTDVNNENNVNINLLVKIFKDVIG